MTKSTTQVRQYDWPALYRLPDLSLRDRGRSSATPAGGRPVRPRVSAGLDRSRAEQSTHEPPRSFARDVVLRFDPPSPDPPGPPRRTRRPGPSVRSKPVRRSDTRAIEAGPTAQDQSAAMPALPAERDGISAARDGFFVDHAKDLIARLAQWSLRLDDREQELDERECSLERRARTLRQLQWLAAATSNRRNSADGG